MAGPRAGAEQLWAIGRTMRRESGRWQTVADTRIPAGGKGRWMARLPRAGADAVEISLWLFPDWHYARVFREALAGLAPGARPELRQALQAAETSGFLVEKRDIRLP
ncbi:MAG: hypothetical protein R3F43_18040 [bacterium]